MRTVDQTVSDDWRNREADKYFDDEPVTAAELAEARQAYASELRHIDLGDEMPRRGYFTVGSW